MTGKRRPSPGRTILAVALVLMLLVAAVGIWAAGQAGVLPGQPEATRIPVTPFADIPGFDFPTPPPLPTPAP